MKEQIEEMACEKCLHHLACLTNSEYVPTPCRAYEDKAEYRKQSKGEWIDKPTGAYGRMQSWCSACGKHSGIGGIESNRYKPFCPNCGAKMKGAE